MVPTIFVIGAGTGGAPWAASGTIAIVTKAASVRSSTESSFKARSLAAVIVPLRDATPVCLADKASRHLFARILTPNMRIRRYNRMDMRLPNFTITLKAVAAMSAAFCLVFPALASAQQDPYPPQQPYPQQQQGPYPQQPPYPQQQGPYPQQPSYPQQEQPYPQQEQPYPQQGPSYALPPPTYANRPSIKGTISGFDGQWTVYMHDQKGYTDHITLHQGTIINPTGIKLLEGMKVTIYGQADGSTFQADRVDVAYSPYSPYYGSDGSPAYGYGYGGYPYYG
ncbi:MAG: hypothetical protein WAK19_07605, partial [Candidatus Cybelea sp.]